MVWFSHLRDYSISLLEASLIHNSRYLAAYQNRGLSYLKSQQYDEAIQDFTDAINLQPNFDKAFIERCHAYYVSGLVSAALSDCNRALELNPNSITALYYRAYSYMHLNGQEAKAIPDVQRLIQLVQREDVPEYYKFLGDVYARVERYAEAVEAYERYVAARPDTPQDFLDYIQTLRNMIPKTPEATPEARP